MFKKCIIAVALLVFLAASACAEEIDLSAMTDEDLRALRTAIDAELQSRNPPTDGDLIVEDDWYSVSLLSWEIVESYYGESLVLHCEWTNKRDEPDKISDWVAVSVTAARETLYPSRSNMGDMIRAHSSHEFDITYNIPEWADSIVVVFRSFYRPSNIYKTYTFNLE